MNTQEQQELEKKALDQLLSGKSLFGKDGAFAPMLKAFIEKALEAEMAIHLSENPEKNKRNGKGKKTLKTNIGSIEISTPADRNSSFEPSIVNKTSNDFSRQSIRINHWFICIRDEFTRYL
ncbi:MAG: putative transposase [Polaribacter sp.]|jgi:putative transposase